MPEEQFELLLEGAEQLDHQLTSQLWREVLIEMKLLNNNIEIELEGVLKGLPNLNESTRVDAARPVTSFDFYNPLFQLFELVTDKLLISKTALDQLIN